MAKNLLNGILKIEQPDANRGLRVNIDTLLLAKFAEPKKGEAIIELGCAHGAISLIIAKRGFPIEAIDIQPHLIEMAKENAVINNLAELTDFHVADIRQHRKLWRAQSFDRVIVNPPYYEPDASSSVSPHASHASAVQETDCTLSDVVSAARYLLKNKGKLDIIMTAKRLGELLRMLEANALPAKRLRFVHPKPESEASVVLVEAVRAAKKYLTVLPPLFVLDSNGDESEDMKRNYSL